MKSLKSARALAASLSVLAFGALAASPAQAFDEVHWTWTKDVTENVDIDVYIDVDVESTGLVEIEKLQIFFGSVKADSEIGHVTNNQPEAGDGGTTGLINETFQIITSTDDENDPSDVLPGSDLSNGLTLKLTDGTLDEGSDVLTLNFTLTGEADIIRPVRSMP